jgi:hypothetical protein
MTKDNLIRELARYSFEERREIVEAARMLRPTRQVLVEVKWEIFVPQPEFADWNGALMALRRTGLPMSEVKEILGWLREGQHLDEHEWAEDGRYPDVRVPLLTLRGIAGFVVNEEGVYQKEVEPRVSPLPMA